MSWVRAGLLGVVFLLVVGAVYFTLVRPNLDNKAKTLTCGKEGCACADCSCGPGCPCSGSDVCGCSNTKPVTLGEKWAGQRSTEVEAKEILVKDDDHWKDAWENLSFTTQTAGLPKVDFTKNMVLAVHAGTKPSAGYSVEFQRAERTGNDLTVYVSNKTPSPGLAYAAVMTSPFSMVVLPKTSGDVSVNVDGKKHLVKPEKLLIVTSHKPLLSDWTAPFNSVKAGGFAHVNVDGIRETSDGVEVFLVDHDNQYLIGRAAFYPAGVGKSNFVFDLTKTLKELSASPCKDSYLSIKRLGGRPVVFDKAEVQFQK